MVAVLINDSHDKVVPALAKFAQLPWQGRLLETDFQAHLFHLQQCFSIAFGIIDRMVSVFCFSQVFEVYKGILLKTFVERTKIGRAKAEGVLTREMVEVPVDKLPVESIIVRYEYHSPFAVFFKPSIKTFHH